MSTQRKWCILFRKQPRDFTDPFKKISGSSRNPHNRRTTSLSDMKLGKGLLYLDPDPELRALGGGGASISGGNPSLQPPSI